MLQCGQTRERLAAAERAKLYVGLFEDGIAAAWAAAAEARQAAQPAKKSGVMLAAAVGRAATGCAAVGRAATGCVAVGRAATGGAAVGRAATGGAAGCGAAGCGAAAGGADGCGAAVVGVLEVEAGGTAGPRGSGISH